MPTELDELDRRILLLLQDDGSLSNAALARTLGLSPAAMLARVRRMESDGLIRRYVALLDHERLGFDMVCFVLVALQVHSTEIVESFRRRVRAIPEVLECHHITGEYDYLLKIMVRNRRDLERLVVHDLTPLPGVARLHTSLALAQIKQTTALPLEQGVGRGE